MKALNFSIFKSKKMSELLGRISHLDKTNSNIIILGETGVGKTEAARWIHENSNRSDKPFYTINGGALSKEFLLHSLFGVTKGAYKGCQESKPGILEKCDGGTLLIDSMGALDISIQNALLRSFSDQHNEWVFSRIGGTETKKVNVRVIAAENSDIQDLVADGLLREEFCHRITKNEIHIPALRDRKEDIETLINFHIGISGELENTKITAEAVAVMKERKWTGNIRELFACLDVSLAFKKQEPINYPTLCVEDLYFRDYGSPQETEKKSVLSVGTPASF
jgi:two-component system, NtrC family, response regulator HydG